MIIDPVEAETEVNWRMKPKTHKRKCMFLYDSQMLYLPEPRETAKEHAMTSSQVPKPDINTEANNIKTDIEKISNNKLSTQFENTNSMVTSEDNSLSVKSPVEKVHPGKKTDMMSVVYFIIGLIHILMNLFMLGVLAYTVGYVLYFATVDITYKIRENRDSIAVAIEEAKKQYKINRCDPTTRVPALEKQCSEWNYLISNGFNGIKYTRIVVEMLADVMDGFVSKFKLRNIFTLTFIFVVYLLFRNKK